MFGWDKKGDDGKWKRKWERKMRLSIFGQRERERERESKMRVDGVFP